MRHLLSCSLAIGLVACGESGASISAGDGRASDDSSTATPSDMHAPPGADLAQSTGYDSGAGTDQPPPFDAAAASDFAATDGGAGPMLPAAATCAPRGDACNAPGPDAALYAVYRHDFFYAYKQYPEAKIPDPVGGRVQIATTATASGSVISVELDGVSAEALEAAGKLDWYHVWPRAAVAGRPLWVTFHSHDMDYAPGRMTPVGLVVRIANGTAVNDKLTLSSTPVPITYVTTVDSRDALLVYLKNRDNQPHTIDKLIVDGGDLTDPACIADTTLQPGEAALITVPLCSAKKPGAPWTVVVTFKDASAAVGVGRVITQRFPIHHWPASSDCAFPLGNGKWFNELVAHRFDTWFLQSSYPMQCKFTGQDILNNVPKGIWLMPNEGIPPGFNEASRVIAHLDGDEVDAGANPNVMNPKLAALAQTVQLNWETEPEVAQYIGGSRNRLFGTFSGVADIQGMDFYAAACAPHVTDPGSYPPLRGPYDYTVGVRENHMPDAAWTYAQGLDSTWNAIVNGNVVDRQPDAAEARVQAMSVIAGGAKGLMYFQTDQAEATKNAATWSEIGDVNRDLGALRRFVREGDPTGLAKASDLGAVVEAIRSREAIVVPVLDVKTASGPTDAACALGMAPHWALPNLTVDVTVDVPRDFAVTEVFEVMGGQILPAMASVNGRKLTFANVDLGQAKPARLFVIASSPAVRQEIVAGF